MARCWSDRLGDEEEFRRHRRRLSMLEQRNKKYLYENLSWKIS